MITLRICAPLRSVHWGYMRHRSFIDRYIIESELGHLMVNRNESNSGHFRVNRNKGELRHLKMNIDDGEIKHFKVNRNELFGTFQGEWKWEMKLNKWGFRPPLCTCRQNWEGEPPENGEMKMMALPFRHRTRNSSPGGLGPTMLPPRSRRLHTIFNLYESAGRKRFVSSKPNCHSGVRTRDLRLSKQTALPLHQSSRLNRNESELGHFRGNRNEWNSTFKANWNESELEYFKAKRIASVLGHFKMNRNAGEWIAGC